VKATTDGVVRFPSEFSSTKGSPPSMTAMQEFVVPKSMPSIFAIKRVTYFEFRSRLLTSENTRYAAGDYLHMG
jgi:hypothetical protein